MFSYVYIPSRFPDESDSKRILTRTCCKINKQIKENIRVFFLQRTRFLLLQVWQATPESLVGGRHFDPAENEGYCFMLGTGADVAKLGSPVRLRWLVARNQWESTLSWFKSICLKSSKYKCRLVLWDLQSNSVIGIYSCFDGIPTRDIGDWSDVADWIVSSKILGLKTWLSEGIDQILRYRFRS